MMKKKLMGIRISESLIDELKEYCRPNGILINHFVASAIKEKLKKLKKREEKLESEKLKIN